MFRRGGGGADNFRKFEEFGYVSGGGQGVTGGGERQLGADSRGIILKNKPPKREGMVDFNFFWKVDFE